jgi:hypothetical protein
VRLDDCSAGSVLEPAVLAVNVERPAVAVDVDRIRIRGGQFIRRFDELSVRGDQASGRLTEVLDERLQSVARPAVSAVILGARTYDQLTTNLATDLRLSTDETALLDKASTPHIDFPTVARPPRSSPDESRAAGHSDKRPHGHGYPGGSVSWSWRLCGSPAPLGADAAPFGAAKGEVEVAVPSWLVCGSCWCQRPVLAKPCGVLRAPAVTPSGAAVSMAIRSSALSWTSRAAALTRNHVRRLVPGMGTVPGRSPTPGRVGLLSRPSPRRGA